MDDNTKQEIRKRVLQKLRMQTERERIEKSRIISEKLFQLPDFQKSQTILFYASFDGEVETFDMIQRAQKSGKRVAIPKILKESNRFIPTKLDHIESLVPGPYGILEVPGNGSVLGLDQIELAVVPGIAFDRMNNRLGRGGGYYDRFLEDLPSSIPTVGLAFDFQIVDLVEHLDKHDHAVSFVITN